jgi:hypothetical protein
MRLELGLDGGGVGGKLALAELLSREVAGQPASGGERFGGDADELGQEPGLDHPGVWRNLAGQDAGMDRGGFLAKPADGILAGCALFGLRSIGGELGQPLYYHG